MLLLLARCSDAMVLIHRRLVQGKGLAAGPPNLDSVHPLDLAQTKMHCGGMLRTVRIAGHNLPDGPVAVVLKGDAHPYG